MRAGDAFFNTNRGSPERMWVVATDPTPDRAVVIFMIEQRHRKSDPACILKVADHPRLPPGESAVDYDRSGHVLTWEQQETMRKRHAIVELARFSDDVTLRIQEGAIASDFISEKLRTLVANALGRGGGGG